MAKPTLYTDRMIADYTRQGYWTKATLADVWDRNAVTRPDREALVDYRQRLTWAQAKRWIDNTALGLLSLGLKRDSLVVVQLPNWAELALLRVCCEKAGLLCLPVLRSLRESEMKYVLEHSDAEAIIIPWKVRGFDHLEMVRQLQPGLPRLKHVIVAGKEVPPGYLSLDEMSSRPPAHVSVAHLQDTKYPADEFSLILLTSGTTGVPKFVEFPIASRLYLGRSYAEPIDLGPDDTVAILAPAFAGPNSLAYFGAAQAGARIVMLDRFDVEDSLRLIEKERVTVVGVVPTQLAMILASPHFSDYNLKSLRLVIATGSPLPFRQAVEAEEKMKVPLINFYGSVDAGGSTFTSPKASQQVRLLTVGKPIPGVEIKLVTDAGTEAQPGEIGEIWVRGPTMVGGYYKDPALIASSWTPEGWFKTGDYGKWNDDGNLSIAGRKKEMIIRGGQNIYPAELENLLLTHPAIREVAVVSMPDPVMVEKACAFVVTKPGKSFSFEDMTSFLKNKGIAAYKLPERLELMGSFPMVADGQKIDKKALAQQIADKLKTAN